MSWRSLLTSLCATVLLAAPAFAGAPFRTDDPEPIPFGSYELNVFSTGSKTAGGWNAFLPGVEANYGVLPNVQLHTVIPVGYTAPAGGRSGFAMGDIELGVKYRFITPGEGDWFPQVAIFPFLEVPAGNQKLGFSTGHAQVFLPLWAQKDFDPWTVFGGGGIWINPGFHNKNYSFVGAAVTRKITEQLSVGVEVFHLTSSADGVKESTGFNVGTTYDFSDNWHLLTSAGTGIQNRRATNEFSWYVALQLTF